MAIFPIKNLVFFPNTLIPLHIFEPRYRQLIKDIKKGNNRFILTGLKNNIPFSIGVLVEMVQQEQLMDGKSNILVQAIERIKIFDYFRKFSPDDNAYAIGETKSFPEIPINPNEWIKIRSVLYNEFKSYFEKSTHRELNFSLKNIDKLLSPIESINSACYYTHIDTDQKQQLLLCNSIYARVQKLISILSKLNYNLQKPNF